MSHFTVENIIRRVATFHNTTFRLLNTHSGIHAIAMRIYMRFIHHNPLSSFLQIVPIPCQETQVGASPCVRPFPGVGAVLATARLWEVLSLAGRASYVERVGTPFMASVNSLRGTLGTDP